jgi:hypothetical protein
MSRKIEAVAGLGVSAMVLVGPTAAQAAPSTQASASAAEAFAGWRSPTPAQAAARSAIPDVVLRALARLRTNAGAPSAADQQVLAGYHELASVVSRGSTEFVTTSQDGGSGLQAAAAGPGCGWQEGTLTRKTGWPDYSVEYKWHSRLDTCWSGSKVTGINNQYTYVTNQQYGWAYRGVSSSSVGAAGNWSLQDYQQGHMEYCVFKYGCLQDLYPAVSITQYGNGTASYSGWKTG